MPRQRIHHTRETYDFPADFPERLRRFQEESELPWRDKGVRPTAQHYVALLKLADSLGLGHLFTE